MDVETRQRLKGAGITVWLRADLDLLVNRTARRKNRPLLNDDARGTLQRLMKERYSTYNLADIIVDSRDVPHDVIVQDILKKLTAFLSRPPGHKPAGKG